MWLTGYILSKSEVAAELNDEATEVLANVALAI